MKQSKTTITDVTERVIFSETNDGVLLQQEKGSRRTGLWKLPALAHLEEPLPPVILKTSYGITRYKVTLWVHESEAAGEAADLQRVPTSGLEDVAMPSPYRKALRAILGARHFQLKA